LGKSTIWANRALAQEFFRPEGNNFAPRSLDCWQSTSSRREAIRQFSPARKQAPAPHEIILN
jgi:hypothetical protein